MINVIRSFYWIHFFFIANNRISFFNNFYCTGNKIIFSIWFDNEVVAPMILFALVPIFFILSVARYFTTCYLFTDLAVVILIEFYAFRILREC